MAVNGKSPLVEIGVVEIYSDFELDLYEYVSWFTSSCGACGWKGTMRTSEDNPDRAARLAEMVAEAEEHIHAFHQPIRVET